MQGSVPQTGTLIISIQYVSEQGFTHLYYAELFCHVYIYQQVVGMMMTHFYGLIKVNVPQNWTLIISIRCISVL